MSTMPEYGVVRYANLAHAYTHLFMMLYPTVVLALEAEFGLPYDRLLTLSIGAYVLFGVGALPAGWLADRWSGTGMLAVFFLGLGASAILTGLAQSTLGIALGLSLIGLAASIYHPVGLTLLVRNPARRGRTLGINGVFGGLGTAAAALVAGVLVDLFSWRAAFIVPGAVSLATGVGFLWFTRGRVLATFPHDTVRRTGGGATAMAWVIGSLFVIMLCSGLIYQSTQVALPKVFALRSGGLGASLTDVASKVSLVYLVAGLLQIVGGQLADRYAQKFVIAGTYLLLIPVTLFTSTLFGLPLLVASLVMISLNVGMLPVIDTLFTELIPPRWRGTVFGAKFVVSLGISALGVPLVAAIYSRTGSFTVLFLVLSGAAAGVAVAALLLPATGRTAPAVRASEAAAEFTQPDRALG